MASTCAPDSHATGLVRTPRGNAGLIMHFELPKEPPPEGYHRIVKTYDDLVPVSWADVPDGATDPEPMYLSTTAAKIMMMTDAEYDRYRLGRDGGGVAGESRGEAMLIVKSALVVAAALAVLFVLGFLPESMLAAQLVLSAIVSVATVAFVFTMAVRHAPGRRRRPGVGAASPQTGERELPSGDDVVDILRANAGDGDLGWLAERGSRQARMIETREKEARAAIDATFEEGSLSWTRFRNTVDTASATVSRNLGMLANDIQARTSTMPSRASRGDDRRLAESMAGLLDDNDEILTEMRRLCEELEKLRMESLSADSSDAVSEMRRLVEDTHRYSRNG